MLDKTYKTIAEFYDYDNRNIVKDDIDFFIEYTSKVKGSILELSCGTGRITLPIAESGREIWALDISEQMLSVLKEKIKSNKKPISELIHIVQGDMRNFNFNIKFKLIIIPFRTFQILTSDKEQKKCLKCIYDHLDEDGIFIINVLNPQSIIDGTWNNLSEILDFEIEDNGHIIKRTHIKEKIDAKKQIMYLKLKYYDTYKDGLTKIYTQQYPMKYYYQEQIENLLSNSKFYIHEKFGYYDKRSIEDGSEFIFISKKVE